MIFTLFFLSLTFASPLELQGRIEAQEKLVADLKPGNQARIELFAPKKNTKTPLAFLYVHGFSASPREVSPLTENLAKHFQSHAYLMRLDGHGLKDPLKNVRLETWQRQVQEALTNTAELGQEIVVIATSTGAAVTASVLEKTKAPIKAVIFLSPFFASPRVDSHLLLLPFGEWLARMAFGPTRSWNPQIEKQKDYWSTTYPAEATVQPVRAAYAARSVNFEQWKFPTMIAVNPKDTIIDHKVAQNLFGRIPTFKQWLSVPEAENEHVIAGEITAPEGTKIIEAKIIEFLRKTLKVGEPL